MGGRQNYGPCVGTLNIRCRIIMSILGNSEEAGASKNEEARASNNEHRCHYQLSTGRNIKGAHTCPGRSPDAGESPFRHFQP